MDTSLNLDRGCQSCPDHREDTQPSVGMKDTPFSLLKCLAERNFVNSPVCGSCELLPLVAGSGVHLPVAFTLADGPSNSGSALTAVCEA